MEGEVTLPSSTVGLVPTTAFRFVGVKLLPQADSGTPFFLQTFKLR